MALSCQKHLFSLDKDTHYLNCGAYSPILSKSKYAGVRAVELKSNPQQYTPEMHWEAPRLLRKRLGELINCHEDRIAIVPSVSYGLANVANNLHRKKDNWKKKTIVVLQNSFPNHYNAFDRVAKQLNLTMKVIDLPSDTEIEKSGQVWNERVLRSITDDTACIVLPQVHWITGIIFDLKKVSELCRLHSCMLVVDGTQSVGVYPFDIDVIQPDALVCAAYKWLFGPYSIGFAYYSSFFDDGAPIEESWMNRLGSDNFSGLTSLQTPYRPLAQRYNMGEASQFILAAIWLEGLIQIQQWKVERMQTYISSLQKNAITELKNLGCRVVDEPYRSPHLFGVLLPDGLDAAAFTQKLRENRVYVSMRGQGMIRVSVNVFNEELNLIMLINTLKKILNKKSAL